MITKKKAEAFYRDVEGTAVLKVNDSKLNEGCLVMPAEHVGASEFWGDEQQLYLDTHRHCTRKTHEYTMEYIVAGFVMRRGKVIDTYENLNMNTNNYEVFTTERSVPMKKVKFDKYRKNLNGKAVGTPLPPKFRLVQASRKGGGRDFWGRPAEYPRWISYKVIS